jgi:hypothetical protein
MKKLMMAAFCTVTLVSIVAAEDFNLTITKFNDDGTVTGTKKAGKGGKGGKGGFGKGEEVTVKFDKKVSVYKGKYDMDTKGFVKDGDDLGMAGLKTAYNNADKVNITVDGTALTDKDRFEVAFKDGKPAAKLNGKDVDINKVRWQGRAGLSTRVTTNDDGTVTQVLITTFGGGKKGGANE